MPQTLVTPNIPEADLPDRLRDDWLPSDPKPRKIEMARQADGTWTVTRTFD